ncbi:uncharacterized protein [Palaemon carinicauda]|uniref:uncharacterized protein n=1 Tax=Palaemon carinicauda TaxID=392227 RepID=UPI0035B5F8FF
MADFMFNVNNPSPPKAETLSPEEINARLKEQELTFTFVCEDADLALHALASVDFPSMGPEAVNHFKTLVGKVRDELFNYKNFWRRHYGHPIVKLNYPVLAACSSKVEIAFNSLMAHPNLIINPNQSCSSTKTTPSVTRPVVNVINDPLVDPFNVLAVKHNVHNFVSTPQSSHFNTMLPTRHTISNFESAPPALSSSPNLKLPAFDHPQPPLSLPPVTVRPGGNTNHSLVRDPPSGSANTTQLNRVRDGQQRPVPVNSITKTVVSHGPVLTLPDCPVLKPVTFALTRVDAKTSPLKSETRSQNEPRDRKVKTLAVRNEPCALTADLAKVTQVDLAPELRACLQINLLKDNGTLNAIHYFHSLLYGTSVSIYYFCHVIQQHISGQSHALNLKRKFNSCLDNLSFYYNPPDILQLVLKLSIVFNVPILNVFLKDDIQDPSCPKYDVPIDLVRLDLSFRLVSNKFSPLIAEKEVAFLPLSGDEYKVFITPVNFFVKSFYVKRWVSDRDWDSPP